MRYSDLFVFRRIIQEGLLLTRWVCGEGEEKVRELTCCISTCQLYFLYALRALAVMMEDIISEGQLNTDGGGVIQRIGKRKKKRSNC